MSCVCVSRLADLLKALLNSLLPLANLQIPAPPAISLLAALSAAPPPSASLNASLRLVAGLPALSLSQAAVAQIGATMTAAAQINSALGINLFAPGAAARLAIAVQPLSLAAPRLGVLLGQIPAAQLAPLSLTLSTIVAVRAAFGVNLLAPGAAMQLSAAFAAGLPGFPAMSPAVAQQISAYATLAFAANVAGGVNNLMPALNVMAQLQLPALAIDLGSLAGLAALVNLAASLQSALQLSPVTIDLSAQVQAALAPLAALPPLSLPPLSGDMPALPPGFSMSLPGFAASAQALASMNLSALVNLSLPPLAPLSLVASIAGNAGLATTSPCGACPVGALIKKS